MAGQRDAAEEFASFDRGEGVDATVDELTDGIDRDLRLRPLGAHGVRSYRNDATSPQPRVRAVSGYPRGLSIHRWGTCGSTIRGRDVG
jgi:hypothetical protein